MSTQETVILWLMSNQCYPLKSDEGHKVILEDGTFKLMNPITNTWNTLIGFDHFSVFDWFPCRLTEEQENNLHANYKRRYERNQSTKNITATINGELRKHSRHYTKICNRYKRKTRKATRVLSTLG